MKLLYLIVFAFLAACSTNPTIVQSGGGSGLYLDVQPDQNSYKLGAGTVKSDFLMVPNETSGGEVLSSVTESFHPGGEVKGRTTETRSAVAFFEGETTSLLDFIDLGGGSEAGTGLTSAAAVGEAAASLVEIAPCLEAAGQPNGNAEFCK